jgi:transposase
MTQRYIVRLSADERKTLFALIEKGTASKEKQNRARILLKADCGEEGENWKDPQIAEAFYVSIKTVERIRKSLVEEGFEETLNRKMPPPGTRKRIIQGEEEAYLIAIACNEPPEGYAKWTLSLLADKMVECKYVDAVSPDTIGRALKKTNLNLGKKRNGV